MRVFLFRYIIEDGILLFCFIENLIFWNLNKLGVGINKILNKPRKGDAVDLGLLAGDPVHMLNFSLNNWPMAETIKLRNGSGFMATKLSQSIPDVS